MYFYEYGLFCNLKCLSHSQAPEANLTLLFKDFIQFSEQRNKLTF